MNLQEMKTEFLKDEEVRLEYEALAPEYELIKAVLNARKTAEYKQTKIRYKD